MTDHRCFLTHFILCLGIAAGAFLAWVAGLPTMIWAADASHMTSVIGLLFVCAMVWLGVASWRGETRRGAAFGHLCERLAPMLGIAGTSIGLSMQAQSLAVSGTASFGALATSLFCTCAGVLAAIIIALATFNLEASQNHG